MIFDFLFDSDFGYRLMRRHLDKAYSHRLTGNVDSTVRSRHAHRPRVNVTSNHTLSIRPIVRNSANLEVVAGGVVRGVERDIALGMAVCSRHGVGGAIEVVHVGVGVVEDLVVVDVVAVDCSAGHVDRDLAGAAAAVGVRGFGFDFAAGYAVVLAELGRGLDGWLYGDVALSLRETLTARLLVGAAIVVVMAVASTIAREFTENLGSSKRCALWALNVQHTA